MQTTTRSAKWLQSVRTMLLGLVLALGVGFVGGEPDMAWLGFALAAMYAGTPRGRTCLARRRTPSRA